MLPSKPFIYLSFSISALLLNSCSPTQMRNSADREVFGILGRKSSVVPNVGKGLLDITPPPPISLAELSKSAKGPEFLGTRAKIENNAKILPLAEALKLAVTHNREYLSKKELLYLQALDLTLVRHEFTPIFTATGSAEALAVNTPTNATIRTPNPAYGRAKAAGVLVPVVPEFIERQVSTLVTENTLTATGNLGVSVLTRTGARLAADFSTDFLRFLTGNLTNASDSSFAATVTQPLLRGAGYHATMENLTQAERDLMYAIRDFTQYRKTFTVDITSQYYRTLEARDAAKNAYLAYHAFELILGSERALAKEDRRTSSQLGLIEQAALKYERIWISYVNRYELQLDSLKIALAIPVQTAVILDEKELAKLSLEDPGMSFEESIETALVTRLDIYNKRDAVQDTERKIKLAAQDLLPQVDLTGRYQVNGDPKSGRLNLNLDRRTLGGGVDLDLRLDKKADRNAYRSSLIAQQRVARELDLAEEDIRSSLRTSWRDLEAARKQYEIAETGVKLSARRVDEEELLRTLGRGTARDLIDAQQDLIEAKDFLTAALIAHTISRLRVWRDMGILFITKEGGWQRVLQGETAPANDE
ncbi:hypothetical protein BH11VER1_BH11VER1_39670 [soil metagenome]